MNFDLILQLISSLGFPIVMCIILIIFIKYMIDTHRSERKDVTERYAILIEDLTKVISNNTNMISKINEKIDIQREIELRK
jgi:hypothetical protein